MTTIRIDILIRALAIMAVVFNHAYIDRWFNTHGNIDEVFFGLGFGGGAKVLLVLSGYLFAEFILSRNNISEVRQGIINFGKLILLPSFFLILFFFVLLQKFDLPELLFYKNWITPERISKFPTWYPQVILQILIFLYITLSIFPSKIKKHPYGFSLAYLGLAVSLYFMLRAIWPQSENVGKLPTQYLWLFVSGWVIYFSKTGFHLRILTTIILMMLFFYLESFTNLSLYLLLIAGTALIWLNDIRIPKFFRPSLYLISQATFTLFLLHRFFFEVFEALFPFDYGYLHLFLFSLLCCVSSWVLTTGFKRAYYQRDQLNSLKPSKNYKTSALSSNC